MSNGMTRTNDDNDNDHDDDRWNIINHEKPKLN